MENENAVTRMTSVEFAMACLEWGKLMEQAHELEKQLKDYVLTIGKTQTVGNVRVTYSNPRSKCDYERAFHALIPASTAIDLFQQFKVTPEPYVDFKGAIGEWFRRMQETSTISNSDTSKMLEPFKSTMGEPSASVKFVK